MQLPNTFFVKIFLRQSASIPVRPDPPLVLIAVVPTNSSFIPSKLQVVHH